VEPIGFTMADSPSDRNIVQIWNADRTRLVTTVLAIPDYRMQPKGRTVIHFEERPRISLRPFIVVSTPVTTSGWNFVYPKSRAIHSRSRPADGALIPNERRQIPLR